MFDQADQATGADDPPHLAQKSDPLWWWHMMHYADSYREIESRIAVRKSRAIIGFVFDAGIPVPGLSNTRLRHVDSA